MPRALRIDKPYLLQHVIVNGAGKRCIFEDDADRASLLHRLDLLLQETGVSCFAWTLLPDHFHLLLRPEREGLCSFMRRLLTGYAMAFNRRHGRTGHLFRNHYQSTVCDEEKCLLELLRYIHLHPLRSGQIADVKALDRYPWTGHSVLLGFQAMAGQHDREVLRHFGRKIENCRQRYRRFIRAGAGQAECEEVTGGWLSRLANSGVDGDPFLSDRRILGSGMFVKDLLEMYDLHSPEGARWQPLIFASSSRTRVVPVAELVRQVAEILGIEAEAIRHTAPSGVVSTARSVICYLGYRKMGHSGEAVAREIGMTRSGVCRRAAAGEKICRRDRRFHDLIFTRT